MTVQQRQRSFPGPLPDAWARGLRRTLWVEGLVVLALAAEAFLLAFAPRAIGWSTFVVYGGSMEPTIGRGSVAVARPVSPQSLKAGDIIPYYPPGSSGLPTLHRIIEVRETGGGRSFVIKGDANRDADPFTVTLAGRGSKVVYAVPDVGRVAAFAGGPLGRVLFLQVPLVIFGIFAIFEIWMPEEMRLLPLWS